MLTHRNKKSLPYAVVAGLDDYPGLQTARLLAKRGVPVIGVARHKDIFFCRTNACEKIVYLETERDEFITGLVNLGKQLQQKAVLFPCTDMCVLRISRHRATLAPYYHLALPKAEVVEKLMNKLSFLEYALQEKLPIPKTFLLRNRGEAEAAAKQLKFPCILKPPMKTAKWEQHTTSKAYKLASAKEFLEQYEECCDWADILIAQEWIPGPDSNLYSCNCYFDEKAAPLVTFTARKLRQWPPETGSTSLGEECRNNVVLHAALDLFKKEAWHGLGYLEMKRDARTGKHYIIEPNLGRPTGRSALAEASGVELLYTMYCDKTGLPLPENRKQQYRGVKWMCVLEDLRSARIYWQRGELTFGNWWRSVRGKKTYADFSWTDPLPFLFDVKRRVAYKLGKLRDAMFSKKFSVRPEAKPISAMATR
ncbi:carboxylate--amine ligase [candidate division KSB1 bacterium]|nr:carboxylate--amine ligase [candidate division KSB1 bacterium]